MRTKFGYHVLTLQRHVPEERISYDQARDNLRTILWPELQRREFKRYLDGLMARHQLGLNTEALEKLGAASAPSTP